MQKLAILFERHHRGLFRYFVSMNRNRELSEDLVQDVFFRMLRYRASYDAQQSFTAWMFQIARNASVDSAQKRRGEVIGIDEFTAASIHSGALVKSRLKAGSETNAEDRIIGSWRDSRAHFFANPLGGQGKERVRLTA